MISELDTCESTRLAIMSGRTSSARHLWVHTSEILVKIARIRNNKSWSRADAEQSPLRGMQSANIHAVLHSENDWLLRPARSYHLLRLEWLSHQSIMSLNIQERVTVIQCAYLAFRFRRCHDDAARLFVSLVHYALPRIP